MKLIIEGAMSPFTDIDEPDEEKRRVCVWRKRVLDEDLPVKVTIEIDKQYLSEYHQRKLQREGWTYAH